MTVHVRHARLDEYKRVSDFLDKYWAKDHAYVRMPQLFEWTFNRSRVWDGDGYSVAIAEVDGEVAGILGGIPFMFNCHGKVSRGVWLVNFLVRPVPGRGPVALQMLNMFQRRPYSAVIAFGAKPSVIPFYRARRAQILSGMPRHVAVLPGAVDRMTSLLRLTYADWPATRARALAEAFRVEALPALSEPAGSALPVDWDQKEWPRMAARTIGAARDSEYLTWRYLRHPRFTYRVITVPESEGIGLAIWRLETIRRSTPLGMEEVDRIGRLVEFLPVSRQNAKDLLAVLWRELEAADAMGVDYYGYHGEIGAWLRQAGFHGVERQPDGEAIPSRFQPLDGRDGTIRSAIFALQEGAPPCGMDQGCTWYWTKSDADQDRPN